MTYNLFFMIKDNLVYLFLIFLLFLSVITQNELSLYVDPIYVSIMM